MQLSEAVYAHTSALRRKWYDESESDWRRRQDWAGLGKAGGGLVGFHSHQQLKMMILRQTQNKFVVHLTSQARAEV